MHSLLRIAGTLGFASLLTALMIGPSAGLEGADICLKSGVTIHAARIQPEEGGFQVLPRGASAPLTIPADQVKTIGAPCETAASPAGPFSPAAQAGSGPVAPAGPGPQAAHNGPRLVFQGSGAIGEELLPALIQAFGRKQGLTATENSLGTGVREIALTAPGGAQPKLVIEIRSGSSDDAAKGLLDGSAAAGMSVRRLSADEAAAIAAKFRVKLLSADSDSEHVLALDALALITHKDNPITSLSMDQIARIFSGEVSNWKDVRGWDENGEDAVGLDAGIRLHALDAASENYSYFNASIMAPARRELAASAQRQPSGRALSKAVASDPNAIGFVSYAEIGASRALKLATSCGLNLGPSRFSVKTEEYPLARRLYLYTTGKPKDRTAKDFIAYALSNEAQSVIQDAGFIDQSFELQDSVSLRQWLNDLAANPLSGASSEALAAEKAASKSSKGGVQSSGLAEFQKSMNDMLKYQTRTTVIFRFEPNSTSLDSRARQDIARAVSGWTSMTAKAPLFSLVGFADWDGKEKHNLPLAIQRAKKAYAALKKGGVAEGTLLDTPIGLGSIAPVACNDTPEGKAKNRRVELWASTATEEDMARELNASAPREDR